MSTNSTKRAQKAEKLSKKHKKFFDMAQFDVMISFSLIFNLLLILYIYYAYNVQQVIPSYVETKKFRNKISSELNNVKTIVLPSTVESIAVRGFDKTRYYKENMILKITKLNDFKKYHTTAILKVDLPPYITITDENIGAYYLKGRTSEKNNSVLYAYNFPANSSYTNELLHNFIKKEIARRLIYGELLSAFDILKENSKNKSYTVEDLDNASEIDFLVVFKLKDNTEILMDVRTFYFEFDYNLDLSEFLKKHIDYMYVKNLDYILSSFCEEGNLYLTEVASFEIVIRFQIFGKYYISGSMYPF